MNTQQKGNKSVLTAHQTKRTPKFSPIWLYVSNKMVRLPLTIWYKGHAYPNLKKAGAKGIA